MDDNKKTNNQAQQAFREKQHANGLFEVRGAFAEKEHHEEIKRFIKVYGKNRDDIILFINSLDL